MIPKPGGDKARKQGCTCPVMDNLEREDGLYWVNLECPVHYQAEKLRRLREE